MKPIVKQKIHTASGNLEYAKSGEGLPAVILINGGSGPVEGWYKVYPTLAEEVEIFAYNRFGVGGSDKPTSPQHGEAIVSSLRQLLQEAALRPPYILVGHSLGGLYANLFARRYPEEIAGVVLLESSHPKDLAINETQPGWIRAINRLFQKLDTLSSHKKWNETHFVEETVKQIEQAGPFPAVPLVVVSGGKKPPMMPEHAYQLRTANQLDFLQLSPQSQHILAPQSGHFPQMSDPDVVLQAVRQCISKVDCR
ncbi:alpha/beta fold hydrolase [Paenibacillus ihuae]|uniref:alpha/beta fold hydrolase n=1 Tax=Paenibacillus ihuae TaxID=1232431 RepID=UPI0006D5B1D7|nr:alpha/beta fold hydrolase [Paenibacillus ihuae]